MTPARRRKERRATFALIVFVVVSVGMWWGLRG